jgi:pimeloyl-ACP methyl ester carboxylesterase
MSSKHGLPITSSRIRVVPALLGGVTTVPVQGGLLTYEIVAGSTEPVLAIHGVSSQRRLWNWLHVEAPELTLIAPDLRGRGDSVAISGPFSLAQHLEDMITILDQLEIDSVHVLGMSIGGFVAMRMAVEHPARVKSLILVDGGFPMSTPPGLTREMVPALFADRIGRLEHSWVDLDDYIAFIVTNTAPLLHPTDPLLRDNLAHDLRHGRVRLSPSALLVDAADTFFDPNPWKVVQVPIRFAHAEWSVGPNSRPGYPAELVDLYRSRTVDTRLLPGADHAATIMTHSGAAVVGEMIKDALRAG